MYPADRPVQRVTDRHTGVLSLPHASCLAQPCLGPGSKPRRTATKRGHGLRQYPRYSPRLLPLVISLFSEQTKCQLHYGSAATWLCYVARMSVTRRSFILNSQLTHTAHRHNNYFFDLSRHFTHNTTQHLPASTVITVTGL